MLYVNVTSGVWARRTRLSIFYLLLMAALGVLLIFAGSQLALTLLDMKERKDLFVPLMVVGITLASNLAVGFITGIALSYALKSEKLRIYQPTEIMLES